MSLYGNDLDEDHTPAESGIAWTIDLADESRDFIGRETLEDHKLFGGRSVMLKVKRLNVLARRLARLLLARSVRLCRRLSHWPVLTSDSRVAAMSLFATSCTPRMWLACLF